MKKEQRHPKRLRSGFTTGACAAAASKAGLLKILCPDMEIKKVSIPFPDGSRHEFALFSLERNAHSVVASVIKDAGDDPDVTNGAEIGVEIRLRSGKDEVEPGQEAPPISFRAGPGVGTVTRKGLAVPKGEPAINPGPRRMIASAIEEAFREAGFSPPRSQIVDITIFIKDGEKLAHNTLNPRLGIKGGLSVLGTTGIVRPISAKAWTDTIDVCLNVAEKAGLREVILSTGRTSEAAVQGLLGLPDEALVMMGDYLEYALKAAGRHRFKRLHLAGMWAKIIKAALEIPQTHVRHGALDMDRTSRLLIELGMPQGLRDCVKSANTARHVLDLLLEEERLALIRAVCHRARQYAERLSGIPVTVYLVSSEKKIITQA